MYTFINRLYKIQIFLGKSVIFTKKDEHTANILYYKNLAIVPVTPS